MIKRSFEEVIGWEKFTYNVTFTTDVVEGCYGIVDIVDVWVESGRKGFEELLREWATRSVYGYQEV